MTAPYLIRYRYPGTVAIGNGPMCDVGPVYVDDIGWLSPGCFSYTYDPKKATAYPSREAAERVRIAHWWPESECVPLDGAPALSSPQMREAGAPGEVFWDGPNPK